MGSTKWYTWFVAVTVGVVLTVLISSCMQSNNEASANNATISTQSDIDTAVQKYFELLDMSLQLDKLSWSIDSDGGANYDGSGVSFTLIAKYNMLAEKYNKAMQETVWHHLFCDPRVLSARSAVSKGIEDKITGAPHALPRSYVLFTPVEDKYADLKKLHERVTELQHSIMVLRDVEIQKIENANRGKVYEQWSQEDLANHKALKEQLAELERKKDSLAGMYNSEMEYGWRYVFSNRTGPILLENEDVALKEGEFYLPGWIR